MDYFVVFEKKSQTQKNAKRKERFSDTHKTHTQAHVHDFL